MERTGILENKSVTTTKTFAGRTLFAALCLLLLMVILCHNSVAQIKPGMSNSEIVDQINHIVSTTNWTNEAEAAAASRKIEELSKLLGPSPDQHDTLPDTNLPADSLQPADQPPGMNPEELFRRVLDAYDQNADDATNLSVDLAKPVRDEIILEYEEEQKATHTMTPGDWPKLLIIDFNEVSSEKTLASLPEAKQVEDLVILYGPYANKYTLNQILKVTSAIPLKMLVMSGFKDHPDNTPGNLTLSPPPMPALEMLYWIDNGSSTWPPLIRITPLIKEVYLMQYTSSALINTVKGLKNLETLGYSGQPLSSSQINEIKTLLPHCNLLIK